MRPTEILKPTGKRSRPFQRRIHESLAPEFVQESSDSRSSEADLQERLLLLVPSYALRVSLISKFWGQVFPAGFLELELWAMELERLQSLWNAEVVGLGIFWVGIGFRV